MKQESSAFTRGSVNEWFPRKITMPEAERAAAVPTFHALVDFLPAEQLGQRAGRAELHAAIDRNAQAFLAGMADERGFGLAKFWATRMTEHGVDMTDDAAIARFMAAVNTGEIAVDQDVLGEILRRRTAGGELNPVRPGPLQPPSMPPVSLASFQDLTQLAESSVAVARLRAFVDWVGAGRTLTKAGRLRVADARELAGVLGVDQPYLDRVRSSAELPEVTLVVAWARATRVVRVVKGRLLPVRSASGLLRQPLDLWRRALSVFDRLGRAVCDPADSYWAWSVLAPVFGEAAPMLFISLYTAGGRSVPLETLGEVVHDQLNDLYVIAPGVSPDLTKRSVRTDLRRVVDVLADLGAVDISTSIDSGTRLRVVELTGREDVDHTAVRLTPLGLWGVRELLVEQGVSAPLGTDLADGSAQDLYQTLEGASAEVADVAMAAWVDAREHDAAAELAAFCAGTTSPSCRLFALAMLERTGAPGVAEARLLRAAGGVTGAVAATWLVRRSELDADSMTNRERLLTLTDECAALHEQGALVEALTERPVGDQIGMVRAVADADHPGRTGLLDAIAATHPEPAVAEAARAARREAGAVEVERRPAFRSGRQTDCRSRRPGRRR